MVAPTPQNLHESLELRRIMNPSLPATFSHPDDDDASLEREPHEIQENESFLFRDASAPKKKRRLFLRLGASFFLFGLINNVLYVIILSAALDLVPPSTPKGIIVFCNITPALIVKVGWPYVLKGRIRYVKRLIGGCIMSVLGMWIVAAFDGLNMRLLGIGLASFSSGLGELTFLQLSTTYRPLFVAGHAVGYFASGTGAAGLVGAALWWFVRFLGVRLGIGLSSIMPIVIPLTYAFLLPSALDFVPLAVSDDEEDTLGVTTSGLSACAPIPTDDESNPPGFTAPVFSSAAGSTSKVALTAKDKWKLVRPLLTKYMLPLSCVYLFEYTINQGVAPTLVYPVPSPTSQPFLSHIIKSIRDYYPLWQLVYQATVFLSRSSLSLGIRPLPSRFLPLPAILQAGILVTLAIESAYGIFDQASEEWSISCVFILISAEGICGGLAYVNAYYHVGQERSATPADANSERARQEREFKIGSIGFADSLGILCASIAAVPTEVQLCKAQVRRGKMFCTQL